MVAWWLFAPKFWEVAGTYESLFCSKMNAASVVVTCEVMGTLHHYKMVKKILNFVHLARARASARVIGAKMVKKN